MSLLNFIMSRQRRKSPRKQNLYICTVYEGIIRESRRSSERQFSSYPIQSAAHRAEPANAPSLFGGKLIRVEEIERCIRVDGDGKFNVYAQLQLSRSG